MKKLNLSLVTILAMTTFATANSPIVIPAPVVAPVEPIDPVSSNTTLTNGLVNEFYIGGAYGLLGAEYQEDVNGNTNSISSDEDYSQAMLQVGYKINPYFGFEGRYWIGMSDQSWENTFDGGLTAQVDTWGVYTKFFLPIGDSFDIYALLGYAEATYSIEGENFGDDDNVFDGFSWGIGTNFDVGDNMSIYVDYVGLYNDFYTNYRGNDAKIIIGSLNIGMNFIF